ncbi:MAG TPA: pilus assembly PilX N-terminal domain-containing protein, partial [Gemmatimonadaceae bacterium]|nr:pilus assembly PilX N-terminal domain-containing protein [Gemmatimonadaceae bacterium]
MRRTFPPRTRRAKRRGSALILVLLMTVTLAAVAMSAILLTGSGTMLTKYYDREREFRYAAEAALAMGKARMAKDTSIHLPDSGYVTLLSGGNVTGADGLNIPRVKVNLYAGKTGNTTGQFGQYASIVAEAYDAGGTRYVRRLELQAENFARYAMFTNIFPGVCYTTGEFIRGRAHSNQGWNNCGAPTYYDTVSAHTSVTVSSAIFKKGYINGAAVIPIPAVSQLAILHARAVDGNLDIVARGSNLGNLLTRLEFVAIDLDNDGDIIGKPEGFFRVYQANTTARLRVAPVQYSAGVNSPPDSLCGDWHIDSTAAPARLTFWPTAVHNAPWMWARFNGKPPADTFSTPVASVAKRDAIMANPSGFRCYAGGDPHLVAIE